MATDDEEEEYVDFDFEDQVDHLFAEIYKKLEEMGVPGERMPTTIAVLSHVMESVDETRLDAWIRAYAGVEGKATPK